ncbi:MAG: hypothetical protein KAR07_07795 [Spirochaetes bacterium]|nr:hypothetical protein [Spirochaetota bacterium]
MGQINNKKVKYVINKNGEAKFQILNYNKSKAFSSFFPGIAGLMGIPLWCFYVNRGQCVSSFGVESKNSSIMEFLPANKAYGLVHTHGFRTLIKYKKDGKTGFYEPFQQNDYKANFDTENIMTISPYDLTIRETNVSLNLEIQVRYFTIPNEPVAALAREVTIKNIGNSDIEMEIIDGFPAMIPFGISEYILKKMSRTIEAWTYVENIENNAPFYRVVVGTEDSSKVTPVYSGNFYFAFTEEKDKVEKLKNIIDPRLIFKHSWDYAYPYGFMDPSFDIDSVQHFENRTPAAMSYTKMKLTHLEDKTIYSLTGHAETLEELNALIPKFENKSFFVEKSIENDHILTALMSKVFMSSNSSEFDAYARQTFLDNILRGGYPVTMKYKDEKEVLYVYSRKHGDLERDYNDFLLMPTYFSQGNGNFRDINQNRRNDLWFNVDVGFSNIHYFLNLMQLDGHNPLVIKGLVYIYESTVKNDKTLLSLVPGDNGARLLDFLEKPFLPHNLISFVKDNDISLAVSLYKFISAVIIHSRKEESASHHEGFWVDHWFYNIDLIESYEGLFPDKMGELLFSEMSFSYFDSAYYIVPRSEKYVIHEGVPAQLHSVRSNDEKLRIIEERHGEKNKVRTKSGKIYHTSLFAKLMTLTINKLATLDAHGIGIEMEADKPGWNDAMNGLPALFGSSLPETIELKRLVSKLLKWIDNYAADIKTIDMPEEICGFYETVKEALRKNLKKYNDDSNFKYWQNTVSAKEKYRHMIMFGITGVEKSITLKEIEAFLTAGLNKLTRAIDRGYNKKLKIHNTYFINHVEKYEFSSDKEPDGNKLNEDLNIDKCIYIKKFKQETLPPFLECQMHLLKAESNPAKAQDIYKSVRASELYDKKLGMYKVNGSLKSCPLGIGRARVFTPGWLENESIFLHMQYKYLLSLLESGLYNEFFTDIKTGMVPFFDPEVYGRSIFENSSFIVSSVNPDTEDHGSGYVARLSGSTAEFYHILLMMTFGKAPFYLNKKGKLELILNPTLPGWLFSEKEKILLHYNEYGDDEVHLPMGTFCLNFLGNTLVVYHNSKRNDTYGEKAPKIKNIVLTERDGNETDILGPIITYPHAGKVRAGSYGRIDIWFE